MRETSSFSSLSSSKSWGTGAIIKNIRKTGHLRGFLWVTIGVDTGWTLDIGTLGSRMARNMLFQAKTQRARSVKSHSFFTRSHWSFLVVNDTAQPKRAHK